LGTGAWIDLKGLADSGAAGAKFKVQGSKVSVRVQAVPL
jgi:hypothetical protein